MACGLNDPANVYLIRDVSTLTNVFIIGGDRADFYKVNPGASRNRLPDMV